LTPAPATATAPAGAPSLPLSRRNASLLAYAAGWISGLLLLTLEAHDRDVRWHAAQSLLGFGLLTLLAALLLAVAAGGLFVSIGIFRACVWAAQAVIAIGFVLWAWSMLQVLRGRVFRWPLIAGRADRLAALGGPSAAPLRSH